MNGVKLTVTDWDRNYLPEIPALPPAREPEGRCTAVILHHNAPAMTLRCVHSLLRHAGPRLQQIFVLDNGSDPGQTFPCPDHPRVICERVGANLGFAGGCNAAMRRIQNHTDLWFLNNDTVVFPQTLEALYRAFADPRTGAAGSVANRTRREQRILPKMGSLESCRRYAAGRTQPLQAVTAPRLVGLSLLVRREALEQVGWWDERFFPGCYEDDDYSLRLTQCGWKMKICPDSIVYHEGSATLRKMEKPDGAEDVLRRMRRLFEEKWKASESELFDNAQTYFLTPAEKRALGRVAELGAHCGGWLAALQCGRPDLQVQVLPRSPHCAALQMSGGQKIQRTDQLWDGLDAVFCTDLPPETMTPAFFAELRRHLRPGGRLYIRGISPAHHALMEQVDLPEGDLPALPIRELIRTLKEGGFRPGQLRGTRALHPYRKTAETYRDALQMEGRGGEAV